MQADSGGDLDPSVAANGIYGVILDGIYEYQNVPYVRMYKNTALVSR